MLRGELHTQRSFILPRFIGANVSLCANVFAAHARIGISSTVGPRWANQDGDANETSNGTMVAGIGDVVCVCRRLYAAAG